jgi:hypothetical protein
MRRAIDTPVPCVHHKGATGLDGARRHFGDQFNAA